MWFTIEHVAKFSDDRPIDLGDSAAKKDLNYSDKTEWPAAIRRLSNAFLKK